MGCATQSNIAGKAYMFRFKHSTCQCGVGIERRTSGFIMVRWSLTALRTSLWLHVFARGRMILLYMNLSGVARRQLVVGIAIDVGTCLPETDFRFLTSTV